MAILLHGTKLRRRVVGVLAIDCPWCGERTLAEGAEIESCSTIYNVPLRWHPLGLELHCRRCLCRLPRPTPFTFAPPSPDPDTDTPDDALIQATNPHLPPTPPPSPAITPPPPPELSRERWALLRGLLQVHQEVLAEHTGWSNALIYPIAVIGILAMLHFAQQGDDFILLGWGVALTIAVPPIFAIYQFRQYLVRRTLHQIAGGAVRRHLARSGATPRELFRAALRLGKPGDPLRPYLRWLSAATRATSSPRPHPPTRR